MQSSIEELESRLLLTVNLPVLSVDPIFENDGFVAGASANDESLSVSPVGDINADGFADFAVVGSGAFPSAERGDEIGAAYVFFGIHDISRELTPTANGKISTAFFDPMDLDGANGFVIPGAFPDAIGSPVARLGDTNGDGIDDVAVTRLTFDEDTGDASFTLRVLYGNTGPWPRFVTEGGGFSVTSGQSDTLERLRMVGGDFNGDGLGDLAIRSLETEFAYIIFGTEDPRSSFAIESLDGSNGYRLELSGVDDFAHLEAADVNDDGVDDLLISEPAGNEGHIVFGSKSPSASQISIDQLNGENGFTLSQNNLQQLVGVGDVNNDGVDDLAVVDGGAEIVILTGPVLAESGTVRLSHFAEDNQITFSEFANTPSFSTVNFPTVAAPGDVNGDGIDDLLFGNPNFKTPEEGGAAGQVRVVYGHASLSSSPIDEAIGFGYRGPIGGSESGGFGFGRAVHSLGDFDGDEVNDILFRFQPDNGGGAAVVVFGTDTGFPGDANQDNQIDFQDFLILANNFGKEDAVFADGDFDGDGRVSFLDFLVLAENFGKSL